MNKGSYASRLHYRRSFVRNMQWDTLHIFLYVLLGTLYASKRGQTDEQMRVNSNIGYLQNK